MIAQLDDCRVAGDLVDVDEALALVRRLRREAVARQPDDDLRGQLERVDEPVLAPAGMLGAPVDGHDEARRGERLVVQLAGGRAVERVRRLGPEALEVEVVGARAELLVGVEADAQRPVRQLGMRDQVRDRRHDLGDARLVVGAEQRRAVARDQVVPDVIRQLRRVLEGDHLPLVAGEHDLAALVADALRLDVRAGDSGDVSTCARNPIAGTSCVDGRGHRREEIAVLVEVDVREPELDAARRAAAATGPTASPSTEMRSSACRTACRSARTASGAPRRRPRAPRSEARS